MKFIFLALLILASGVCGHAQLDTTELISSGYTPTCDLMNHTYSQSSSACIPDTVLSSPSIRSSMTSAQYPPVAYRGNRYPWISSVNAQMVLPSLASRSNASAAENEALLQGKNVVADGGADNTGHTDVTAAFSALERSNPGGTLIVPAGTYLFSQNHTVPGNVSLQFMNGAQIATGNQGLSKITSISRASANSANIRLNLVALRARSAETVTTETIIVPNNFVAGNTVVLSGLSHVKNGIFVVTSAGTNATQFTVNITNGVVKTVAVETGTVRFDSGSVTNVIFSKALAGATVGGQVICMGTTNYNGPYLIQAIADSLDYTFQDFRVGAATETSGSCYVPYHVIIKNAVIAGPGQQIVAANSAVSFWGAPTVYPQWYGAEGDGLTNDWLPIQETLYWNPGRDITLPKRQAAIFGSSIAGTSDYSVQDTLQMYGNGQNIHGTTTETWDSGVQLTYPIMPGPGIIVPPNSQSDTIYNLNFYGSACQAIRVDLYYYYYPHLAGEGPDGIMLMGARPRVHDVQSSCWRRNGILIDGSGQGGAGSIFGAAQPDYWHLTDVFLNSNRVYNLVVIGHDTNGGVLDGGNTDLRYGLLGGIYSASQTPDTYQFNGEGNSDNVFPVGATQTIQSLTVSGSGSSAICTLVAGASLTNGLQYTNTWIAVSGTDGSGGASGTDTPASNTINVNAGTKTIVYPCPGARGGPAMTGRVGTASTKNIFAWFSKQPTGYYGEHYVATGMFGGPSNGILINPYCESTNGMPQWASGTIVIGGNCAIFNNLNPNGNNAVFLSAGSDELTIQGRGINFHSPTSNPSMDLTLNSSYASSSAAYAIAIDFQQNSVNHYNIQEQDFAAPTTGSQFSFNDFWPGDNRQILLFEQNRNVLFTAPGKTGAMNLQPASNGNVNFFARSSTTISSALGITTNGLKDTAIAGSTQCLEAGPSGAITGTGSPCGSGTNQISIGPVKLPTSTINTNTCAAAGGSPFTAKGVTTSMVVAWGFALNPNSVSGYGALGGLSVSAYPTSDAVNIYVCNPTSKPITPGSMTVNVRVLQ